LAASASSANGKGRGSPRPCTRLPANSAQAGCHWLSTASWSRSRWTWSWTLATHESGIVWCMPSGLSFLVSLIVSSWTWSTWMLGDGLRAYNLWGDLAYQLAGAKGYRRVENADKTHVAPGTETIRELFGGKPT
jgi:hypothetical protein